MENFVSKEESWILEEYKEAYNHIMKDPEKCRKELELIIVDYGIKTGCYRPNSDTLDVIEDYSLYPITALENALQLSRLLLTKTTITKVTFKLARAILNDMYGGKGLYKHRDDYTLWVDFLVGWYFNRITQWEVDNESTGASE